MNLNADRLGAHYKDAQVVFFYLKSENISKNGGKRNEHVITSTGTERKRLSR